MINKGASSVRGDFVDGVIISATEKIKKKASLTAFVYENPGLMILFCAGFIFILFVVVVMLVFRTRTAEKQRTQSKRLARFMGYVCKANDLVM